MSESLEKRWFRSAHTRTDKHTFNAPWCIVAEEINRYTQKLVNEIFNKTREMRRRPGVTCSEHRPGAKTTVSGEGASQEPRGYY